MEINKIHIFSVFSQWKEMPSWRLSMENKKSMGD